MKSNVLIVDDMEAITRLVGHCLKDEGYNIFTASNGHEALKVCQEEKITCIISDIHMPQMDGITLLRELRKIDQEVPFIFLTIDASKRDLLEALELKVFDFLEKPLDIEKLKITIKNALSREQQTVADFDNLISKRLNHTQK